MTDIFFSYSSRDRDRVQPVHDRLTAHGFDAFWDQSVPSGLNWDAWIRQHLGRAKCALVFWSAASVLSDNVVHEATVAKHQGKLLPIMLDPLTAEQFPMGLYTVQAANLTAWAGDTADANFARLVDSLEERITPLWLRRRIDRLEAELVAERARREATERRDRTLQEQISKEAGAQVDILRERDRALADNAGLKAELTTARKALDDVRGQVQELQAAIKATSEKLKSPQQGHLQMRKTLVDFVGDHTTRERTPGPSVSNPAASPTREPRPSDAATCASCAGVGKVKASNGFFTIERTCPQCQGKGYVLPMADQEAHLWRQASRPDGDYGQELWAKKDNLNKYLAQFPSGSQATAARSEIRRLEEAMAWQDAQASGKRAEVQAFLDRYPNGVNAEAARQRLRLF